MNELFGISEQLMKGEMGKMKITYHEVASEVENLARELKRHGNEALSHKDKIAVSDLLAETVQMIRRKYEITTMYYLTSEHPDSCPLQGFGFLHNIYFLSPMLCSGQDTRNQEMYNQGPFSHSLGEEMESGERCL